MRKSLGLIGGAGLCLLALPGCQRPSEEGLTDDSDRGPGEEEVTSPGPIKQSFSAAFKDPQDMTPDERKIWEAEDRLERADNQPQELVDLIRYVRLAGENSWRSKSVAGDGTATFLLQKEEGPVLHYFRSRHHDGKSSFVEISENWPLSRGPEDVIKIIGNPELSEEEAYDEMRGIARTVTFGIEHAMRVLEQRKRGNPMEKEAGSKKEE